MNCLSIKNCFLILFLAFTSFGCAAYKEDPISKILSSPEKNVSNFSFNPESELISRVHAPPDFLLKYIRAVDKRKDYSAYQPTREDMDLIKETLNQIPEPYQKLFKKRLAGIYFVNHFMGGGMADFAYGPDYQIYPYLMLNPMVLKNDISEWLTIRENSCFMDDRRTRVKVDCGKRYSGLMYILLHEGAHVVDYVGRMTPFVEPGLKYFPKFQYGDKEFIRGIWRDYDKLHNEIKLPCKDQIAFYGLNGGPKLSISSAPAIYEDLQKTPFVSLYSATNWADDYADYLTFYVLTEELKQPYKISVIVDGKETVYEPFESELKRNRIKIIQPLFKEEKVIGNILNDAISKSDFIDQCEFLTGWDTHLENGASGTLVLGSGKVNDALGIDYDLSGKNWVQFYNKPAILFHNNKKIKFYLKWTGARNNVEFKLSDDEGSNFGKKFTMPGEQDRWQEMIIPIEEITYLWGTNKKIDKDKPAYLWIAVTKNEGDRGALLVDEIEMIP